MLVGVCVAVAVGVDVAVLVGVSVGGTDVFVGVLVGVSVGGTGVFVGVLVGSLPEQTWLKLKNVLSPSEVAKPESNVSGVGVQM